MVVVALALALVACRKSERHPPAPPTQPPSVSPSPTPQTAIPIQLPKAATGAAMTTAVSVSLAADGQLFLNGQALSLEALRERFVALAQSDPDVQLVISADRAARHGAVVEVIDAAKASGIRRFALATAPQ